MPSIKPRQPLESALWFATAVAEPTTTQLQTNINTDIAIVGAGYAGLSTALHLTTLGYQPTILESKQIGFGGSGRNGGQVIPGLALSPHQILQKFGVASGEKLIHFAANTSKAVLDLIDKYQLDVPNTRTGIIEAAHNQPGLKRITQLVQQWKQWDAPVEFLNTEILAKLLGTKHYPLGGWIDKAGATIQPLSLVRELARIALNQGAQIFTNSSVVSIKSSNQKWQLSTANGCTITAKKVLICNNGYNDFQLWPKFNQSVLDAISYQTATEPLPTEIANSILPQGQAAADSRFMVYYYRKDHNGRFLIGGRGPYREPTDAIDWLHLQQMAVKIFPQLAGIKWQYNWSGRIAMTLDSLPHIHQPAPGIILNTGCQGNGVALQTALGKNLADYLYNNDPKTLPLPISKITALPLYGLKKIAVAIATSWYSLTDR